MKKGWWIAGILFALLFNLAGFASGQVGGPGTDWYRQLALPALQPPGAVFGIAWSLLYTLMGFAFARVWATPLGRTRTRALRLFLLQLALNLAWSPLFFGAHQVLAGLVLLAAILLATIAATVAMARVDRLAPWLMLPYLVWLGFAFALNWRIWQLNGPTG